MTKERPRILIQNRFRTHSESIAATEKLCGHLPKGEYIVLSKVNRQYFERKLCVIYLPRAVSLTGIVRTDKQRNKC